MLFFFLALIYYLFSEDLACKPPHDNRERLEAAAVWDYYIRLGKSKTEKRNWRHWQVPILMQVEYGRWLIKFVTNRLYNQSNLADEVWYQGPDDADPERGVDPPEWAYVYGQGKPLYCFDHPLYGNCDLNFTRWGFNHFRGRCETYIWSGCGGTFNNFVRKTNCDRSCSFSPATSCNRYGAYVEDKLPNAVWPGSQMYEEYQEDEG